MSHLVAIDPGYSNQGASLWDLGTKELLKANGWHMDPPKQETPLDPRVSAMASNVVEWVCCMPEVVVIEYPPHFSYGRSRGMNLREISVLHDLVGYLACCFAECETEFVYPTWKERES